MLEKKRDPVERDSKKVCEESEKRSDVWSKKKKELIAQFSAQCFIPIREE